MPQPKTYYTAIQQVKPVFINIILLCSSLFCMAQTVNFEPSLKIAFEITDAVRISFSTKN